jgi:hypothetical protein
VWPMPSTETLGNRPQLCLVTLLYMNTYGMYTHNVTTRISITITLVYLLLHCLAIFVSVNSAKQSLCHSIHDSTSVLVSPISFRINK